MALGLIVIASVGKFAGAFIGGEIGGLTRRELIGSSHKVDEIKRYLGDDSLGYLSLAPLVACDRVVIPVEPHALGLPGVASVIASIERAIRPDTQGPGGGFFSSIKGQPDVVAGTVDPGDVLRFAAGNIDASPAVFEWKSDTTPPAAVIDARSSAIACSGIPTARSRRPVPVTE